MEIENEGNWESLFLSWARKLRFKPKDVNLFKMALTHSSLYANKNLSGRCMFESLEFLGDAVLGLAIAEYIYKLKPNSSPGELTLMHTAIIKSQSLSNIAREIKLSDIILMSKGEESSGGRNKDSILEDALEAFVGALYIDQGWARVKKFIYKIFRSQLEKVLEVQKDSKTVLQEFCHKYHFSNPEYRVIEEEGPEHQKLFKVVVFINNEPIAFGEGKSKKIASHNAAQNAMALYQMTLNNKKVIKKDEEKYRDKVGKSFKERR
ncbi:MAG TPA: ribonuclease III [Candidatus Hydrogenedens sp.]|nr:ribonuclease III [Candidatus Hydrogenedens sp.]HOK09312.1 ribonuclease III [Candidatus Hydrogenedens sp.]HOL19827.1 ribonuclease III [Candidatus Hydrogenedens sp.]HPP58618.1 ribonuclease III [Candidatus Hydrogenedens sp.]